MAKTQGEDWRAEFTQAEHDQAMCLLKGYKKPIYGIMFLRRKLRSLEERNHRLSNENEVLKAKVEATLEERVKGAFWWGKMIP